MPLASTLAPSMPVVAAPFDREAGGPVVTIKRRRDATGDLLEGWTVRWANGSRCAHATHAEAWGCLDYILRS